MSLLHTTSPKHCANQHSLNLKKLNKKLLYTLSTSLLSLLALAFLIYLILHPSNPKFYLKDTFLNNSTIHTTVVSTNPNSRVAVYYDHLRAFAAYKGEQITAEAVLPPFYQGHGEANFISAVLEVGDVWQEPLLGFEVSRELSVGKLMLGLKVEGQLRWKIGTWVSARYPFDVNCAAVMGFGAGGGAAMSLAEGTQCSTTV